MAKTVRKRKGKTARARQSTVLGSQTLLRDAAALFSFLDSISAYSEEDRKSTQYLKPSKRFFSHIRDLGDGTKAFLNAFAFQAPKDSRLYQDYRQKLETIRSTWFELHQLIKPAIDADTLSIPYVLVEALTGRLNRVAQFEQTEFAMFHSDELNYFEVPIAAVEQITERLRRLIPDTGEFPKHLGLIGIPYSQSSAIYLNSLIAHEMGHFVFAKLNLKQRLLADVKKSLEDTLGPDIVSGNDLDLDWAKDRLEKWSAEIFCDLFAVWLVGPCYTLAYVELIGLTTVLDPSSRVSFTAPAGSNVFKDSHPADLFRLKYHISLLKKLGWWEEVSKIKSHYVDVLRNSLLVEESEFEFRPEQKYTGGILLAFIKLAPVVENLLADVMKDSNGKSLECGVDGYKRFSKRIGEYLAEAIVPSTVFDGKDHWYPDLVAIMNESIRFYLESLDKLMEGIEDQKTSLAGHRSRWMKRIESLTGKAIEDHQLLVSEKGAIPIGRAFKRADPGSPQPAS